MIPSDLARSYRTLIATPFSQDVSSDEFSELAEEVEGLPSEGDAGWTRAAVAAFGGALLLLGLRRRSIFGTVLAVAGGWLLYRSVRGGDGVSGGIEASSLTDRLAASEETVSIEQSVTVGKPADDLYDLWRDPEQLTKVMAPIGEVTAAESAGDGADEAGAESEGDAGEGSEPAEAGEGTADRLQIAVDTPLDRRLSWEIDVVEDRPGELLRWESAENASVAAEMEVRFEQAPADRGTEVAFEIRFEPPAGNLGARAVRRLEIVPETVANEVLSRFKSLAETGEIPTLEKNPSARGKGDLV